MITNALQKIGSSEKKKMNFTGDKIIYAGKGQ